MDSNTKAVTYRISMITLMPSIGIYRVIPNMKFGHKIAKLMDTSREIKEDSSFNMTLLILVIGLVAYGS